MTSTGSSESKKTPKAESPVEFVNLTELSGDLFAFDAIPVGKTLFVFGYYTNNPTRYDSSKVVMKAFSIDDICLLYEYTFPYKSLYYGSLTVENGGLIIQFNDEEIYKYYRATEKSVEPLETTPDRASGIYRLSDTAVIKQTEDGGLALEKNGITTTLFTGVPFSDQTVNIDASCYYVFKYRLSDTSFLYMKYGYEWVDECGVYDIVTGKSAVLTHPNTDTLLPRAADNGRVILIADTLDGYTSYGPYVYDSSNGEINDLAWFSYADDGNYPSFGLFGDTLAALSKENGGFAIRLCNLTGNHEPRIYQIADYETAEPSAVYDTNDAIWFITRGYSSSDTYLFYISK